MNLEKTKVKAKTAMMKIGAGLKEMLPPMLIGTGIGMLAYGYAGAINNGIQIDKLRNQVNGVQRMAEENQRLIEYNANASNHNIEVTKKRFEELEANQKLLTKTALKITAGEA